MLRLFVLVLLLANGLFFAWSHGLLRAYGFAPASVSEPQRMAQQIKPESITLLSASEIKRVEAQVQADLAPKECLQAG
ncbi:MAG: SPOR domain-containing protein, partial [Burkholderiaceae bacterium]|nr:SPOR domain-containing protein [Burkholderiaceae bacterium]